MCAASPGSIPPCREALRGTYAGMATAEITAYLASLGVTAVELLPVHTFIDDSHLLDKGLKNYWGYNTIGFFAPARRYAANGDFAFAEFKEMVAHLHEAGLEVILDVVYNHTAEGNQLGPTLSFKGIDNASYYRLAPDRALLHQRHRHRQHGEPQQFARPADGDGQPALLGARHAHRRLPLRPRHHPRPRAARLRGGRPLPRCLPAGPGAVGGQADRRAVGSRTGRLPGRAASRRAGPSGTMPFATRCGPTGGATRESCRRLASRLTASADLFAKRGRKPWASVNFITAHDGFTLADLVTYNDKHNEANGENNQDGHSRQSLEQLRRRRSDRRSGHRTRRDCARCATCWRR